MPDEPAKPVINSIVVLFSLSLLPYLTLTSIATKHAKMDDALWRAALLTVPSVLWIYIRFFNIFRQRYHIISHHTKTGGVRMATHLAAGVILLLVLPLLAFLCIPPSMRPRTWLSDCSSICDSILIITGLLLLALNISTLWLVPHPKRHGEYSSKLSKRGFAMSLSIIHATNFQFLAMTASAFAVMCHIWLLKVYLFGVVLLLYLASLMICIGELNSYAWEENTFLKEKIFPFMPYGPLSKSNMIGGVGESLSWPSYITLCALVTYLSPRYFQP